GQSRLRPWEAKMKKLVLILLAAASLLETVGIASAQYYYGGGYYYPSPYYGDRYRGYYDGGYYQRQGYGYGGALLGNKSFRKARIVVPGWTGRSVPARLHSPGRCLQTVSRILKFICEFGAAEVGGLFNSAI